MMAELDTQPDVVEDDRSKSLEMHNRIENDEQKEAASQDGQEWQTISKKKRNREKRNEEKRANKRARVEAHERQQSASIRFSNNLRLESYVKMRDLQGLVLYLLTDGPSPQWTAISGRSKIGRVVVLQLPGFDADVFSGRLTPAENDQIGEDGTPEAAAHSDKAIEDGNAQSPDEYYPVRLKRSKIHIALKPLADVFTHWWPIRAAGEDKTQFLWSSSRSMLSSPIPKPKAPSKGNGTSAFDSSHWTDKRTNVTHFIATLEELASWEYVIHPAMYSTSIEKTALLKKRAEAKTSPQHGWIDSKVFAFNMSRTEAAYQSDMTGGKKIIAMDCEMCKTSDTDFELTRVSIVDWNGSVILDELVKPPRTITDYLTPYSGITEEMLQPVSTTLEDVQKKLLDIVTEETIIIGHSLNSDLNALRFAHPYLIDTAIIFPHARGAPLRNSLKFLTQRYLNRQIQAKTGSLGHDSIEDARAVLDLVKQKCAKGPDWGMSGMSDEPIYKRLGRTQSKLGLQAQDGQKSKQSTAHVAYFDAQNNYGVHADMNLVCNNDEEVVLGIQKALDAERGDTMVRGHDFVWATLRRIEEVRGWRTSGLVFPGSRNDIGKTIAAVPETKEPSSQELSESITDTVQWVKKIYDMLPTNTAFIVYSGAADRREWLRLQQQHQQFKREYQTRKWDELTVRWTDAEEQALRKAYRRARDGGVALITVKNT